MRGEFAIFSMFSFLGYTYLPKRGKSLFFTISAGVVHVLHVEPFSTRFNEIICAYFFFSSFPKLELKLLFYPIVSTASKLRCREALPCYHLQTISISPRITTGCTTQQIPSSGTAIPSPRLASIGAWEDSGEQGKRVVHTRALHNLSSHPSARTYSAQKSHQSALLFSFVSLHRFIARPLC